MSTNANQSKTDNDSMAIALIKFKNLPILAYFRTLRKSISTYGISAHYVRCTLKNTLTCMYTVTIVPLQRPPTWAWPATIYSSAYVDVCTIYLQNVPRQNVPRQNDPRQNFPATKFPKPPKKSHHKMSQIQSDPATKCPKHQNAPTLW